MVVVGGGSVSYERGTPVQAVRRGNALRVRLGADFWSVVHNPPRQLSPGLAGGKAVVAARGRRPAQTPGCIGGCDQVVLRVGPRGLRHRPLSHTLTLILSLAGRAARQRPPGGAGRRLLERHTHTPFGRVCVNERERMCVRKGKSVAQRRNQVHLRERAREIVCGRERETHSPASSLLLRPCGAATPSGWGWAQTSGAWLTTRSCTTLVPAPAL